MPTYRYSGPHDAKPQEIVAEHYERDDENLVTFFGVTSFNNDPRAPGSVAVRVVGAVLAVDEA